MPPFCVPFANTRKGPTCTAIYSLQPTLSHLTFPPVHRCSPWEEFVPSTFSFQGHGRGEAPDVLCISAYTNNINFDLT